MEPHDWKQNICKAKDTVSGTKWQPTAMKKIFTSTTSDRILLPKFIQTSEIDENRDPQPNIRLSLVNPEEEKKEGY